MKRFMIDLLNACLSAYLPAGASLFILRTDIHSSFSLSQGSYYSPIDHLRRPLSCDHSVQDSSLQGGIKNKIPVMNPGLF